jgi:hypothetical protein
MRSSFSARGGFVLTRTPRPREQAARRLLVIVCAMLGLALASGLIGSLTHPSGPVATRPSTGPFSYIPSE